MNDDRLARLRRVRTRIRGLRAKLDEATAERDALVAEEIRDGTADLDIMDAAGIASRDTISSIRKAYDIPPRQRGRKRDTTT